MPHMLVPSLSVEFFGLGRESGMQFAHVNPVDRLLAFQASVVACDVAFFFQAEDGIRDDLVTGVQTCALPILGEGHDKFSGRLDAFEDRIHGDALPGGVERGPLGDAVDVLGDVLGRQLAEVLPGPLLGLIDLTFDDKRPLSQSDSRRRASREDRKVAHDVLSRRHPRAARGISSLAAESARYERHGSGLLYPFYLETNSSAVVMSMQPPMVLATGQRLAWKACERSAASRLSSGQPAR